MSMESDKSRWESPQGVESLREIVQIVQSGGKLTMNDSPFGLTGLLGDFRGLPFPDDVRTVGISFKDVDLTGTSLRGARIEESVFENVKFDKADLRGMSEHGNSFEKCSFQSSSFQRAILGYKGTSYRGCLFEGSNFRAADFIRAEFDDCIFSNAKLKGVDFDASSFVNCSFSGKLEDVWFRGTFPLPSMTEDFGFPRRNRMESVSFAEASLWRITFSNDCDLSSVIMPSTGEYRRYCDWKRRLVGLEQRIPELSAKNKEEVKIFAKAHLVHAKKQDWFILNCDEVFEEYGEQLGRWIIDGLDSALVKLR